MIVQTFTNCVYVILLNIHIKGNNVHELYMLNETIIAFYDWSKYNSDFDYYRTMIIHQTILHSDQNAHITCTK